MEDLLHRYIYFNRYIIVNYNDDHRNTPRRWRIWRIWRIFLQVCVRNPARFARTLGVTHPPPARLLGLLSILLYFKKEAPYPPYPPYFILRRYIIDPESIHTRCPNFRDVP
jgi:hypothetical protein